MQSNIAISIDDVRWQDLPHLVSLVRVVTMFMLQRYKVSNKYISVVLTGPECMKRLNDIYRGKDSSTDVLSFSAVEAHQEYVLGDVFINYDDVVKDTQVHEKSSRHLAHLVIHGFLHLLGYDHIEDEDAEVMEKEEGICLINLGFEEV